VAGLLDQAEGNLWEEQDEDETPEPQGAQNLAGYEDDYNEEDEEFEGEADEDLLSYVDETGLMIAQALERLAAQRLAELPPPLLQRLAATPDLTLLDATDEDSQPAVVHDFASLRAAAVEELRRR
jgi:hypothetical protein